MNLDHAQRIAADLRPIAAVVTLDQAHIGPALAAGRPVVLIAPPTTRRPDQAHAVATWTLYAIAGPRTDKVTAWAHLDALTAAIADALEAWPEESEPIEWTDLAGQPWPGYSLTYTTHHDITD